ncbi:calmodulin-like protein 6, partial [Amborella trichopoda]|uniref:calmodulin-like protein 6 n=1 Tax=Amborella trichopoda TaxID=13333 RepID=UPI0005D3B7BA
MCVLELPELQKIFEMCEQDMVGEVSVEEIFTVLSRAGIGIGGDELKAIVGSERLNFERGGGESALETWVVGGEGGEDWKMMIQKFDENLDGRLDFQEFKNMMLRRNVL